MRLLAECDQRIGYVIDEKRGHAPRLPKM
jgi:hypothetical protein